MTTIDLTRPTVIDLGTPATLINAYGSSAWEAVVTAVEYFKSGDRIGCVKSVTAQQLRWDGVPTGHDRRFTYQAKYDALLEVGSKTSYLRVGVAFSRQNWD